MYLPGFTGIKCTKKCTIKYWPRIKKMPSLNYKVFTKLHFPTVS